MTNDTELPFPKPLMASLTRTNTLSELLALKVSISVSTALATHPAGTEVEVRSRLTA